MGRQVPEVLSIKHTYMCIQANWTSDFHIVSYICICTHVYLTYTLSRNPGVMCKWRNGDHEFPYSPKNIPCPYFWENGDQGPHFFLGYRDPFE